MTRSPTLEVGSLPQFISHLRGGSPLAKKKNKNIKLYLTICMITCLKPDTCDKPGPPPWQSPPLQLSILLAPPAMREIVCQK